MSSSFAPDISRRGGKYLLFFFKKKRQQLEIKKDTWYKDAVLCQKNESSFEGVIAKIVNEVT